MLFAAESLCCCLPLDKALTVTMTVESVMFLTVARQEKRASFPMTKTSFHVKHSGLHCGTKEGNKKNGNSH